MVQHIKNIGTTVRMVKNEDVAINRWRVMALTIDCEALLRGKCGTS